MASCDTDSLLAAARPFSGLPSGTLQLVIAGLLCQIAQASNPMACNVDTLLADARCFNCVSSGELQLIMVQLLCEILQGGGLAAVCVTCSESAPSGDPPCDCSVHYGKGATFGSVWVSVDGVWEQILGGP